MLSLIELDPSIAVNTVEKISETECYDVVWAIRGFVDCPLSASKKSGKFNLRCEEKSFTCIVTTLQGIRTDEVVIDEIKQCKRLKELCDIHRNVYYD